MKRTAGRQYYLKNAPDNGARWSVLSGGTGIFMDKREVIMAYRRGLISLQECAQILGLDNVRLVGLVREAEGDPPARPAKRPVRW